MKIRMLLVCIALQGCATMSVDECATADWRAFGFEDGAKGETMAKADRRENACVKHGYAMNRDEYNVGRDMGLTNYCTPGNGYSLGEYGRAYNGVCGNHGEAVFFEAHNRGYELYGFTSAVGVTQSKHSEAKSKHSELDSQLDKYSSGYRDEGLTMEEHNNMVLGLWAERKYLAKKAIPYWDFAQRYAREELNDYKARVAAGDPAIGNLQPRQFPGPKAYHGPSKNDAREMLAEVFSNLGK